MFKGEKTMSLQFKPEDDFKIDNIITATANKKGIISTNGDGTTGHTCVKKKKSRYRPYARHKN